MLIDNVVSFAHQQYSSVDTKYVCEGCTHPTKCSGSCKACLEQVHYPGRYPNGKKDYDCANLIDYYICDYSHKYASEILYLLQKSGYLLDIDKYHVLSIGCGACPDLMAFEAYINDSHQSKEVSYIGVDKNELWKPHHDNIIEYASSSSAIRKVQFVYEDATEMFLQEAIPKTNVLVLQYLISYFYSNNQVGIIDSFFDSLVRNIVDYRDDSKPFVIIINDVNSNNLGRDIFKSLLDKVKAKGLHGSTSQFYFDGRTIKNDYMRYGTAHESSELIFQIPAEIENYEPWHFCTSAQLLIEIDGGDEFDN